MPSFYRQPCPPNTRPYVIRPGDTIYGLARRFGTSVPAIISANPFVNPQFLQPGQRICIPRQPIYPACPEGNYYTIRPGDTLYAIARFFNVSVDDLIEANPAINPYQLMPGQVICIPLATPPVTCPEGSITYTVRRGDTFYAIARRFNISVRALIRANPGINPQALLIGQKICIPRR
ncbi:MAG: LysM peptidoglycan-binding domain-containing protein [Bacillaceae bacterium]|nr:LysM peptidoglycan-binding domain-containing protein [Bacillaceae bacterium]